MGTIKQERVEWMKYMDEMDRFVNCTSAKCTGVMSHIFGIPSFLMDTWSITNLQLDLSRFCARFAVRTFRRIDFAHVATHKAIW